MGFDKHADLLQWFLIKFPIFKNFLYNLLKKSYIFREF